MVLRRMVACFAGLVMALNGVMLVVRPIFDGLYEGLSSVGSVGLFSFLSLVGVASVAVGLIIAVDVWRRR